MKPISGAHGGRSCLILKLEHQTGRGIAATETPAQQMELNARLLFKAEFNTSICTSSQTSPSRAPGTALARAVA